MFEDESEYDDMMMTGEIIAACDGDPAGDPCDMREDEAVDDLDPTAMLDAQLRRSEGDRDYVTVAYKGEDIEVKPLGKFASSAKYILMLRDGKVIQARDRELG